MEQTPATTHILTVSQLTDRIKSTLEGTFPDIWVEGEISNLSLPQSGHAYFTLKDEFSQVRAVLFRSSQRFLKFTLQHGLRVICRCRVSVYEPRGEYQVILDYVEPKGAGALQLAFQQLKARLEKEGLFDLGHKRPLPALPRKIGIITSPTGAAIRDILRVIKRRHPNMHIVLYPVPVQGAEAGPAIIEALAYFNRERKADVLIVGRGGGSLEDLWAFNEESVARAIYSSAVPVLSAVGHETDYTISDFVADMRAATPSAAAEMVVESEARFRDSVGSFRERLIRTIQHAIRLARASVLGNSRLLGDPRRKVEQLSQHVDDMIRRMSLDVQRALDRGRERVASTTAGLLHLNPLGILSRGYSITKKHADGLVLRDSAEVAAGDTIVTTLHRGEVVSRVQHTIPARKR